MSPAAPRLGLRENAGQFALLVVVNAFVGAMVGLERSILPGLAAERFQLAASTAVLSFIAVFGVSKALANLLAGRWADAGGRKRVLVAGWALAAPVPALLLLAPSWGWVLAANVLLGLSQGLTWSAAVIMKVDLVGPRRRGLALGLNEFAGYLAVGLSAWATGFLAARDGLGPAPFALGFGYVAIGGALSVFAVRETAGFAAREAAAAPAAAAAPVGLRAVLARTTWGDRDLSAVTQAGFVNNLNDGVAWGLFPLRYAAAGLPWAEVAVLTALVPAVWGLAQLGTGAASDRLGRKPLIVVGMLVQAIGLALVAAGATFGAFAAGAVLLGLGTAAVYPTLLATIGDVAGPGWRASALGVYRLWRDLGYAAGAVAAGLLADAFGLPVAIVAVAGLTAASGLWAGARLRETAGVRAGITRPTAA